MKYDRDLIDTMYLLQQKDEALAERIWNQLAINKNSNDFHVKPGMTIPHNVVLHLQMNNLHEKVRYIKLLREQTGYCLKDAFDAVVAMHDKGILTY